MWRYVIQRMKRDAEMGVSVKKVLDLHSVVDVNQVLNFNKTDSLMLIKLGYFVGWGGFLCESEIDECMSAPCQNGAVCIDLHADYACACLFGTYHIRCTGLEINSIF